MSERGKKYWEWASTDLHCRIDERRLTNGLLIDVQARLTAGGDVQLFVGVYDEHGTMLFEDAYLTRPNETMTQAMAWGVQRAMAFVNAPNLAPAGRPIRPEPLPRKGSRQSE